MNLNDSSIMASTLKSNQDIRIYSNIHKKKHVSSVVMGESRLLRVIITAARSARVKLAFTARSRSSTSKSLAS
jgi:hypothetical protein